MSSGNGTARNNRGGRALGELLVLEFGDQGTQYCGKVLADMGAQVVKVEPPGGVKSRHIGPFRNDVEDANGSLLFWAWNTSKKSVVLDLEDSRDLQKARRLAGKADIVLEDYPPRHLGGRGLGYETLSKRNPGLIYTSVTPFGQTGPLSHWKGGDLIQWAMGGNLWLCGYDAGGTPPLVPEGGHSWLLGGHWAVVGTLMALYMRDMEGVGQHVDVSIQEACSINTQAAVPMFEYQGQTMRRHDYRNLIKCADGRYFYAQMVNVGPDVWQRFVSWLEELGMAGELADDRFFMPDVLGEEIDTVYAVLEKVAATMTAEEIWAKGQLLGLTWMKVNRPEELVHDEQLNARDFYQRVLHPELGASFVYPGPAYLWEKTPWRIERRAPLLGEDQHLLDELGEEHRDG